MKRRVTRSEETLTLEGCRVVVTCETEALAFDGRGLSMWSAHKRPVGVRILRGNEVFAEVHLDDARP